MVADRFEQEKSGTLLMCKLQLAVKRILDVTVSLLGLLLLFPVFVLIGITIKLESRGPVLFTQERIGLHGRRFRVHKFRTMREVRDPLGKLLPDAERLTWVGKILRRVSLDELPQLWDVLKGEMSLVGPRPLLADYEARYNEFQRRRHEVRPGLTGWAQVRGRNALEWEQKFTLDVWYVDHWSSWLDFKILFLTVVKVLKREGISQPGHATVEYFRRSRQDVD